MKKSLEDRFYPEEKDLITKVDNSLIKLAGKIGNAYQKFTGNSYKDLIKGLYKVASISSLVGAINLPFIVFSLSSNELSKNPEIETPIEEEIKSELIGQSKYIRKLARLTLSAIGITAVPILIYLLEDSIIDNLMVKAFCRSQEIALLSVIPYTFAQYLSKSYLPDPPKRTIPEKALSNLIEALKPRELQPVRVRRE